LLESVAILPQMFQLQKTGEAETITTHYLLCLGLYRAFYLLNWVYRWSFGESPELISVLAGVLQTALYSDFFYIYYKRVFHGRAFKLPI
jgi:ER lumen protein retaining receptor